TEDKIVKPFIDFLGDYPIVAHNTEFDRNFLKALITRHNQTFPARKYYDTLPLSRAFLFFQPTHNLSALSDYFGLSTEGAHRADSDAENCGSVFMELIHEAASYPLELIARMLALIKPFGAFNEALFSDLAKALTKSGDLQKGLTSSKIEKPLSSNLYIHQGTGSIADFNSVDVFKKGGFLSKTFESFEERLSQVNYAEFVEETLLKEKGLGIAEAGTGLGKTMAYLFPCIKKSLQEENGPVVISCYTKHLQDQLFNNDLPQLARTLDVNLTAVVLKGRNNYICRTRLNWLIKSAGKLLGGDEATTLLTLLVWLEWTNTGDMDECPGFMGHKIFRLKSMVQCEQGFCTTNLCNHYKGCFFGFLRKNMYKAHLLIINHALLLSELSVTRDKDAETTGFLPPYNSLVIDEGHNLMAAAYNQLTITLDRRALLVSLDRVDPDKPSSSRWSNILKSLGTLVPQIIGKRDNLSAKVKLARMAFDNFFTELAFNYSDSFDSQAKYSKKRIIDNLIETFGVVQSELEAMNLALGEILAALENLNEKLLDLDPGREDYLELHQSMESGQVIIQEMLDLILRLTEKQNTNFVYWFDGIYRDLPRGKKDFILKVKGSPIDLAPDLGTGLFKKVINCIITSATLRTDESFQYFLRRTGLDHPRFDEKKTMVFESPFHYQDQVKYFQYSKTDGQNPITIAEIIYSCHKHFNKRIMALFTSRDALTGTLNALRQYDDGRRLPVFAQTKGMSRQGILRGMSQNKNGILLGTNAFWEGVDFPGDLLEILIIIKIPFSVPTEPVVKAYGQMLEEQGGNKFINFSVPEAVIRFRQGFGRLIRTSYDDGIIIVMDDRI
ncbi:MAG: helicase C-terminal domain-containing protein, partial [Candidatus Neomarinimicrobiota bacterium]